jgi:hypothetical protein
MTRETRDVPLEFPFDDGKGGKVTKIVLQEPSAPEFFRLGHPQTWVRAAGGMALVDNDVAIKAYTELMIVQPDPLLAMSQMGLRNAMAVKDAVLGFFSGSSPTQSG